MTSLTPRITAAGSACALSLLALAPAARAQQITLIATETDTIAENDDDTWIDNRLRAYWHPTAPEGHVDGFIKFDFSTIPDGSTIVAMTLRTYHEEGFNNPFQDPAVEVYRCSDDSWSIGGDDVFPGLDEVLTPPHQGSFPSGDLIPYDWVLDVDAVDWSVDMADDLLTLVLQAEGTTFCYVYFYGANSDLAPPELRVDLGTTVGDKYCVPSVANSSGMPAEISATGSAVAGGNPLTLLANQLPQGRFGYFIASQTQDSVPLYQGSQGTLCLGAPLCGFTSQVQNSGAAGMFSIDVDTMNLPCNPPQAIQSGETWNFQAWFRDENPGHTTNFSDAVSITFQ